MKLIDDEDEELKSISGSLSKYIHKKELDEVLLLQEILEKWNEIIVNTAISKFKPYKLLNNALYIRCNDSNWKFELNINKRRILSNVHKFPQFKAIHDIVIT